VIEESGIFSQIMSEIRLFVNISDFVCSCFTAYLWVVGTGLLGYLMFEQFISRGYSWCHFTSLPPHKHGHGSFCEQNRLHNLHSAHMSGPLVLYVAWHYPPSDFIVIVATWFYFFNHRSLTGVCFSWQGMGVGDYTIIRPLQRALRVLSICIPGRLWGTNTPRSI